MPSERALMTAQWCNVQTNLLLLHSLPPPSAENNPSATALCTAAGAHVQRSVTLNSMFRVPIPQNPHPLNHKPFSHACMVALLHTRCKLRRHPVHMAFAPPSRLVAAATPAVTEVPLPVSLIHLECRSPRCPSPCQPLRRTQLCLAPAGPTCVATSTAKTLPPCSWLRDT